MEIYISNLINRLKQFSEDLSKKETFIETPWVILSTNLDQEKYIFKRNGDLIMSLNGDVSIGKWEYLSIAKSLLISRKQDKILLNQGFIDSAIMVLKKDGIKNENFILMNENLLPDLNVVNYLKKVYYQKNNITFRELKDGKHLEMIQYKGWDIETYVTIEGAPIPDGSIELASGDKKYIIENSQIIKVLIKKAYNTSRGKIVIELQEFKNPEKGNFVFQNEEAAPDGKYKLGFMHHIIIENGRIVKT